MICQIIDLSIIDSLLKLFFKSKCQPFDGSNVRIHCFTCPYFVANVIFFGFGLLVKQKNISRCHHVLWDITKH